MGYCAINGQGVPLYECPIPENLYSRCADMGCKIYDEYIKKPKVETEEKKKKRGKDDDGEK